jgi:hypothetical protein
MSWVTDFVDNWAGRYMECHCGIVVKVKWGIKYGLTGARHVC